MGGCITKLTKANSQGGQPNNKQRENLYTNKEPEINENDRQEV